MKFTKKIDNEVLVISIEGKLDKSAALILQNMLTKVFDETTQKSPNGMTNEVHLDCTKISYLSATGLRILMVIEKNAKESGIPFIINGLYENKA
ncbi:MAG: STAS domain-containing protein [Candidatus Cloacimonetes bacterium]|nr:STAS domain-containing protein [Candidatus Cloacimonadota bacterium]